MTQAQPPAAPAAAAEPAVDPSAAALARIEAEFPTDTPPGAGTEPPGAPAAPPAGEAPAEAEFDLFDDAAIDSIDFGDLPYRAGDKLKKELFKARDTFRPIRDALAGLDDDQRAAFLAAAPELGGDLGSFASALAAVHPEDRPFFRDAMALLADFENPESLRKGAEMLAYGASQIQANLDGMNAGQAAAAAAPGTPDPTQPAPAAGAEDAPLTRADLQAALDADRRTRDEAADLERGMAQVRQEAVDLGYDPTAQRGSAENRSFNRLLDLAQEPEIGSLVKAHEYLENEKQAIVDAYVKAKSEGSDRPVVPAGAGTAPAAPAAPLETQADMRDVIHARMDAELGPRRSG